MIAIGGDSGTGKTTLCRGIYDIFGGERIETLCLDDYHGLDRAQRTAVGITALDPRANNFAAMEEDLWRLREGLGIDKPVYDHHDGKIKGPEHVEPKELIIVQGLFPLYTRALRGLFDLSVWLDPEVDLKVGWKLLRDTTQRGYTEEQVRAEIGRRQADISAHIAPQADYADLTVRFYRPEHWTGDQTQLTARIIKGSRFAPLDYSEFHAQHTSFRTVQHIGDGYPHTIIELDGHAKPDVADALLDKIWQHMGRSLPRTTTLGRFVDSTGTRISHALALAQILIARRIVLIENERFVPAS
jgi:phosphoribulokinase